MPKILRLHHAALAATVICLCASVTVFADGWGSGGGSNSQGRTPTAGYGAWCVDPNSNYCPHWIRANISDFETAWQQARTGSSWNNNSGYSKDAHDVCTDPSRNTDGYVYFSGYFGYNSSRLILWNAYDLSYYKTDHNLAKVYSGGNLTTNNFFNSDITNMMNRIAARLGTNEEGLAFFCKGMDEPRTHQETRTGTYSSTSDAQVGNSSWGKNPYAYVYSSDNSNTSIAFSFRHTVHSSAPAGSWPSWTVSRDGSTIASGSNYVGSGGSTRVNNSQVTHSLNLGTKKRVCQTIGHTRDATFTYTVNDDTGEITGPEISYSGWVDRSSEACAEARHPYNFVTNPSTTISSRDVVYPGETAVLSGSVTLSHKDDADTPADYPTTITPDDTTVRLIQFTLIPSYSGDLSGGIGSDPCSFVHSKYGGALTACANATDDHRGSIPTGSTGVQLANTVTVPDVEVGTKLCTAIAANPADSGGGYNENLNRNWKISSATCRTIAKKPNFQVWNGGVATEGSITTSISRKTIDAKLGQASKPTIFGSWDEQLVIAGQGIKGFASGAALGYTPQNYNFSLSGGNASATTLQGLSPLTISNQDNSAIGYSNISLNSAVLDRLKARYTRLDTSSWPERDGIKVSPTGLEYVELPDGANLGQVVKSALKNNELGQDNTRIYYSPGTINITGDLCYGTPCPGTATRLDTYQLGSSSLAALPQILVFAHNINIAPDVTRLDAWLIADGTLNTCAGSSFGSSLDANHCNKTLVINGPTFAGQLQLLRTAGALPGAGPNVSEQSVLARDLSQDGSISPAEIFNLRSDTYLWAYAQAQRFSEAVTTYTRELSPRL